MKEAIKEIIEADTDDMKEVLCLGATFAPTQQIMLSNLVHHICFVPLVTSLTSEKSLFITIAFFFR